MSLDFSVTTPKAIACPACKHPVPVPYVSGGSWNITHNLGVMAEAAGIYGCLWRPEENGITTAGQMIEPLRAGIAALVADPEKFRAMNPSNGWGSYEGLLQFARQVLAACEDEPGAGVDASR